MTNSYVTFDTIYYFLRSSSVSLSAILSVKSGKNLLARNLFIISRATIR